MKLKKLLIVLGMLIIPVLFYAEEDENSFVYTNTEPLNFTAGVIFNSNLNLYLVGFFPITDYGNGVAIVGSDLDTSIQFCISMCKKFKYDSTDDILQYFLSEWNYTIIKSAKNEKGNLFILGPKDSDSKQ